MENKTGKYLKYAIGEIVLVVIGILIALQINNANENSKQKKIETTYLKRLLVDLKKDKQLWINTYKRKDNQIQSAYSLMDIEFSISEKTDTISLSSYMPYFRPATTWNDINTNQATYTELISSGNLDLIENDSIKINLLQLNRQYKAIENWDETIEREHIKMFNTLSATINATNYLPINEDFKKSTGRQFTDAQTQEYLKALEEDFKNLLNENMFMTSLSGMVDNHKRQLPEFENLESEVDLLIDLIEKEISTR